MKLRLSIKQQVQTSPEIVEEKINKYLVKNFYRVTERGPGFVIFIDDEYSDRKRFKSDFHTRIGEGKFEFYVIGEETSLKLIYLTSILYPFFLMMVFTGLGIYFTSIGPILISLGFYLPILYKIYYMNEHVITEILEC